VWKQELHALASSKRQLIPVKEADCHFLGDFMVGELLEFFKILATLKKVAERQILSAFLPFL
jgi:hypothetical protein